MSEPNGTKPLALGRTEHHRACGPVGSRDRHHRLPEDQPENGIRDRVTFDRWGNLLIADSGNDRIRKAVIVTYNPASHRKQEYTFNDKLEAIRQELLSMRAKVREKAPH